MQVSGTLWCDLKFSAFIFAVLSYAFSILPVNIYIISLCYYCSFVCFLFLPFFGVGGGGGGVQLSRSF